MTSNPLPTAETVAELRAINRNYELARGIHFAITSVADALEASQAREAAAEARVTALEAEKAEVRAILKDLVASLNRRGQTLSISHDELSALEARASQALSRSSTEVKNDEAL